MSEKNSIDDRWLDLAAEHRRTIKSAEDQIKQLDKAREVQQKRLDDAKASLASTKAAIVNATAFTESVPKK